MDPGQSQRSGNIWDGLGVAHTCQTFGRKKLFFPQKKLFFWTRVFLDIFALHRIYSGEDFWAKPRCAHISLTRAFQLMCFQGPRHHSPKNGSGFQFSTGSRKGPKPYHYHLPRRGAPYIKNGDQSPCGRHVLGVPLLRLSF